MFNSDIDNLLETFPERVCACDRVEANLANVAYRILHSFPDYSS